MAKMKKRNRGDMYYQKAILVFSGAQVFITSLQLTLSGNNSGLSAEKWGGLGVLVIVASGLIYLHEKSK